MHAHSQKDSQNGVPHPLEVAQSGEPTPKDQQAPVAKGDGLTTELSANKNGNMEGTKTLGMPDDADAKKIVEQVPHGSGPHSSSLQDYMDNMAYSTPTDSCEAWGRPHDMTCGIPKAPNEIERSETMRALGIMGRSSCPELDVLLKVRAPTVPSNCTLPVASCHGMATTMQAQYRTYPHPSSMAYHMISVACTTRKLH